MIPRTASTASSAPLKGGSAAGARGPLFGRKDLSTGGSSADIDLDFEELSLPSAQPRRRTRKEIELEESRKKLAYLHWKRMENETQIREILHTSKRMQERDLLLRLSTSSVDERALRMQSIIHEEASKPLSLPEPFVRDYDSERANQDESYLKNTRKYLRSVKKLQHKAATKQASVSSARKKSAASSVASRAVDGAGSVGDEGSEEAKMAALKGMEEHLQQHMRVLTLSQSARRLP